ncbi:aldehyde dehydrogenase family protein [Arthrobacter methylotrophus]|uniref:Aldehyde dehydrogenase family protein n=1 Tax=Arthrobacter methylotrophus TaxID=121291 RepID=A0ABV5UJQ8_9MICC
MVNEDRVTSVAPVLARSLVGGSWCGEGAQIDIRDPYRGAVVGRMCVSTPAELSGALAAAKAASAVMAAMPGYERAAMLQRIADSVAANAEEIARIMALETGKAIADCRTEAARAPATLRLCAEEAVRIQGEHVPLDGSAVGAGKIAMVMRFPVGVVAAITPFNAPVNLAAHKLGPALAAGNAIILKPSPKAPLSTQKFIEAVLDAGIPEGAVNVLHGDDIAPALVTDPNVDLVSFTGSIPVGKKIRSSIGLKPVVLELGGVGPTFVHHDADLVAAAKASARNAMQLAGQSCASVQNIYMHSGVREEFTEMLLHEVDSIRFGDPLDVATEVGTLIDEAAAVRVMGMVERAVDAGAQLLRGGSRTGAQVSATILSDVHPSMDVASQEVFGPTVTLQQYQEIEPIFRKISESPFGLQCGIYTNSLDLSLAAIRSLRTGGVIVNGTSRWRSDQMPYGGVKDSGAGREGPKFAMRDMTEERFFVFN